MSNVSVNLDSKNLSVKFYLCKPNRETIYPLHDIFNKKYTPRIGELSTLSFSFHSTVLKDNEFVPNPLLDKLKGHYLIRMVMDGVIQYFIITSQSKSYSSSDEVVNVQCHLEPYELTKRNIRGVEETSKSLRYLVNMCLEETNWTIDYIDGDVELLRRSYETGNATILQAVFELAEKFNCIVEFNSNERTISFKKYENIGLNKGIRFKEGIFLESFNLEIKDEDIVTRLVAYGENGLEFRSLTPNGVNYLQDFSWFMFPFECDEDYNVIKSSNYMSDELCVSLVKYHKLLDSVDSQFKSLKLNLTNKQSEIVIKQQELSDLNAEMTIINASIDVINATYQDAAPSRSDHQDLIRRKNEKQQEINVVTDQLNTLSDEVTFIQQQITTLQITISPTTNFTQNELRELTKFIREYEYTNDSIITAQDLLDETKLVFEDLKQPPLSLSMSIEAFADYFDVKLIKKLTLGDTIKLQSKTLKVDVTAKIHGFDYDLDNMTVTVEVANVKSMMDADTLFAKSINAAINTSNTVNLDKYKWKQGENANTLVNQILEGEYDTAKNVLKGGYENSVEISQRGLYSHDINDPSVSLVINAGLLAIGTNHGDKIAVAISKNGCVKEPTYVSSIEGVNLDVINFRN